MSDVKKDATDEDPSKTIFGSRISIKKDSDDKMNVTG